VRWPARDSAAIAGRRAYRNRGGDRRRAAASRVFPFDLIAQTDRRAQYEAPPAQPVACVGATSARDQIMRLSAPYFALLVTEEARDA
jgi:hypothetical protein